ncbi:MAG: hypothetical protein AAB116_06830 [Candidatus Poribacteria bacterium]
MLENWSLTNHIISRIAKRELSTEIIETVLNEPDNIVSGKYGRKIYQKIIEGKLIRIVTEGNTLLTIYSTDKIKKYVNNPPHNEG